MNKAYDNLRQNITVANDLLRRMTTEFNDYEHYSSLRDFYIGVSAYAAFAENPTGSYQDFLTTKNEYENSTHWIRSSLQFVLD